MGEKKSYPVIWSGVLEPKHHQNIGPAIWTFAVLVDWSTDQNGGSARVRGGRPIAVSEIAERLGVSASTIHEHLRRLEAHNYILWKRTPKDPSGGTITIRKNKKVWLRLSEIRQDPSRKSGKASQKSGKACRKSEQLYIEEDLRLTQQTRGGAPTRYESEVLQALQEIPKFRRDETKNLEQIRNLGTDYPQTDIRKVAHELKRKVSEGAYSFVNGPNALRNWVRIANEGGKSRKGPGADLQKTLDGLQRALEEGRCTREKYEEGVAAAHTAAGVSDEAG